jgi:zinc protease
MTRSLRASLALSAAVLLAAQPTFAATAAAAWPQASSDLKADPAVRFGVLPNGMRYAIRKQSIPPGQASLRLRIDAGSMMETDAQQGLAHFLEHMAFNGSKNVKEGEMTKMLERLGLAFGPDTNASTSFGETVYMLELPKTDAETVDTSLMLMRESASNLLIEQAAVDRERGVVLSEERARDTPGYRILKERLDFLLKDQRLPSRLPIGKVEVLRNAPAGQVADFYHRYYRPERAVFVAVGDFDVDAMEAKIRAQFSDWKGVGPAGGDPDQGKVLPRGPEAKLVVEPGAPLSLQIAWVAKPDLAPDTSARRKRDLVESLALAALNRRYSRLARGANPPFIGASAYTYQQEDEADLAVIGVGAEPGRWAEALAAAEQEQRRAVTYGIRQDELDREITEMRTLLRTAVAGANTRRQAELANEIVASLDDDQVVTSPADDLALFEDAVKGLTAETASAALKNAFHGGGPLVFMATPQRVEGGDKALMAAFQASQKTAVTAPAETGAVKWPYESFGPAGQVAERREVADLGAAMIRFANGVRLTVKPTKFRDDEVLIRVGVGDGQLDLSPTRQSPAWATSAYIEGGLKKIETDDMERVLADKVFGARFGISDDAFIFTGSTRPEDLATQMQVLTAYVAEPGFRDEAFQRLKSASKTFHDQFESTPSGVLGRDLNGLLRSGDRRWTFPSRQEIAGAKLEDLTGQIGPHLADGRIDVVIVGDITVEQALAVTAATFGALPSRPEPAPVPEAARKVDFPKGGAPVIRTHKGRADQSIGYVAWPTSDYFADPQRARETAVMSEVMSLRLLDELRETQGATYSPSVGVNHSMVWTGWGYVAASVEVPPEKLDGFFADLAKIAADLKAKPPTDDELRRAKSPRIERLQKARLTNQYWLAELSGAQFDPRRLDAIRQVVPGTEKVTAADVQRAARTWLKDETAFKLIVTPEAAAK